MAKDLYQRLVTETYTNGLIYFLKYLEAGIDPFDFSYELQNFFDNTGIEPPENYSEDEALDFMETKQFERLKPKFIDYLEKNIRNEDASMPTYLFLTGAKLLPRTTWLVHFSDDADDIARSGFIYGAEDFRQIGLTTHFSDKTRKKDVGWNFAFKLNSRYTTRAASNEKYGSKAVIFQSAGVEAAHHGDMEDQVVFWGPAAHNRYFIDKDRNTDEWVIWNAKKNREIYRAEKFDDAAQWVVGNHKQYRKVITNHWPETPIQPTPNKDRARLLAKEPEKMPLSIYEEKGWKASGGRFHTPEGEKKRKKKMKRPNSYEIYKGIPTNPPQAVQSIPIGEAVEENLLLFVKQNASNEHPDDHVADDYAWAREKAFNPQSMEHMMPGGKTGWKHWLENECKSVPGQWDTLMTTKQITEPVIVSPGHIWDGWHRMAAAIINGLTLPAIVGRLNVE